MTNHGIQEHSTMRNCAITFKCTSPTSITLSRRLPFWIIHRRMRVLTATQRRERNGASCKSVIVDNICPYSKIVPNPVPKTRPRPCTISIPIPPLLCRNFHAIMTFDFRFEQCYLALPGEFVLSEGTMHGVLPLHIYQRQGGMHVSSQLMRGIFKAVLFDLQATRNAHAQTECNDQ